MNKVIISGNLTKEMEIKYFNNGEAIIGNMTVANQVGFGDKAKTNFIPVTMFGQRVGKLADYLVKGCKVLIEGEVDYKSVQDDKGNWKNYFSVIVHNIEIIKFKDENPFEEEKPVQKSNKNNKRGRK